VVGLGGGGGGGGGKKKKKKNDTDVRQMVGKKMDVQYFYHVCREWKERRYVLDKRVVASYRKEGETEERDEERQADETFSVAFGGGRATRCADADIPPGEKGEKANANEKEKLEGIEGGDIGGEGGYPANYLAKIREGDSSALEERRGLKGHPRERRES